MARIGFIGASGLMGHGIAKNLLAKGHALALTVHRNRRARRRPARRRRHEAERLAALAADSEIVFICVTGSPQVEAVVSGANGLLAGRAKGLIIVDCSTSEPDSTSRLRERCTAAGVTLVDAPLARTPLEAEAGKLNVMVGADDAVFAQARAGAARFAENVFHVGGPGAGHIDQAAEQLHRAGDLHGDGRGLRGRPARRRRSEQAGRAGVGRRGEFGAVPDDGQDAAPATWPRSSSSSTTRARTSATTRTSPKASRSRPSSARRCTSRSPGQRARPRQKFVPSLVEAQEQLTGAKIVPR